MNDFLKELNLIDLISEKHSVLRKESEELWKEKSNIEISNTEAHLLAKIDHETMSMAKATRALNISRQALHKCAGQLEKRGFLQFYYVKGNSKDKYMGLTNIGKKYCKDSNLLKEEIEKKIVNKIGQNNVDFLKDLFKQDWNELNIK